MDLSQASISSGGAQVQNAQGHHHKHKSISDQLSSMSSAIDNAVKSGKLTEDQAAAMKKKLDDVKQTLDKNQTTGGNSAGSLSQLSDDDKKKIFGELQDVRKQLHSAIAPKSAATGTTSDQMNKMFAAMDANNDGSVTKEEFASFMSSVAQKGGYNAQGAISSDADSGVQGGLSVSA